MLTSRIIQEVVKFKSIAHTCKAFKKTVNNNPKMRCKTNEQVFPPPGLDLKLPGTLFNKGKTKTSLAWQNGTWKRFSTKLEGIPKTMRTNLKILKKSSNPTE
jgi:hypothetical protein